MCVGVGVGMSMGVNVGMCVSTGVGVGVGVSVSVGVGVCGRGRGSGWRALCLVMRGRQSWREASVCSVGGGHRVQRGAPGCDADKLVSHS